MMPGREFYCITHALSRGGGTIVLYPMLAGGGWIESVQRMVRYKHEIDISSRPFCADASGDIAMSDWDRIFFDMQ